MVLRFVAASDPGIKSWDQSTSRVDYGMVGMGRQTHRVHFNYLIPLSLKGKPASVNIAIEEAGKPIQILNVMFDVR